MMSLGFRFGSAAHALARNTVVKLISSRSPLYGVEEVVGSLILCNSVFQMLTTDLPEKLRVPLMKQ